jgi:hypothetical protein
MENSETSCCKIFLSLVIILLISIRLIKWDIQTISDYLSFNQFSISHLWVLAICLSLSATWFSFPVILILIACEKQQWVKFVNFFLLIVCGPNLFILTCVGVYINGFRFQPFRSAQDGYKLHPVRLISQIFSWGMMFLVSSLCCRKIFLVVKKWVRQARRRKLKTWNKNSLLGKTLAGNECSVCLETFKNEDLVCELKCNHSFHTSCIDLWMNDKGTCPLCRVSFNS